MIVLPLNGALQQFRHCKEGQAAKGKEGEDGGGRARRRTTLLMPFITATTLLRTCTRICIVILGSWARVHWFAHPFTKHRVQMYSSFLA